MFEPMAASATRLQLAERPAGPPAGLRPAARPARRLCVALLSVLALAAPLSPAVAQQATRATAPSAAKDGSVSEREESEREQDAQEEVVAKQQDVAGELAVAEKQEAEQGRDTAQEQAADAAVPAPPAAPDSPGIPYTVTVSGRLSSTARTVFQSASQLQRQIDRLPTDIGLLRRRAREDADTLAQIMKSEGFFNATVEVELREDRTPVEVVLNAEEGNLFLLADARIEFTDATPPDLPEDILSVMGLHIGMPAVSRTLLASELLLTEYLKDRGWPYARVADRVATVILSEETMDLVIKVRAGPAMTYGEVTIEGLEDVDPDYIRQRIPWEVGEPYDTGQVKKFRDTLAQSGLFSLVTASPPRPAPTEPGPAEVTVQVEEAKSRSIGAGAFYSTADGPGVRAFWEHRNLLGMGQSLRLSGEISQVANTAEATFRWPWFLEPRQTLALQAGYGEVDTEAYDTRGTRAYAGLERPLGENWKQSFGVSGELFRVESIEGRDNVQLLGVPLKLDRDTSNDLLNPTEGSRLGLALTPYFGESDTTLTFLQGTVDGTLYLPLDESRDIVLANRVRVGSIVGERRSAVPANKRFYLGGGGSLRGYKYQSVSPLNGGDKPIGGTSMFSVSSELRWRFMDDFGVVPFVDAGNAFDNVYPDFSIPLQWAAGLGFLYYTPIGPARVDLAFPLNRRSIDRSFEFYISLGQAF